MRSARAPDAGRGIPATDDIRAQRGGAGRSAGPGPPRRQNRFMSLLVPPAAGT